MHDPDVYPDPDAFRPERFIMESGELNPDVRDPMDFVFGFGRRYVIPELAYVSTLISGDTSPRRICPGRHFAQSTLTMALASFLHVFDIGPPLDEKGNPITVIPAMTGSGMISYVLRLGFQDNLLTRLADAHLRRYPADCRYSFKPRSPDAEALICAHAAMF